MSPLNSSVPAELRRGIVCSRIRCLLALESMRQAEPSAEKVPPLLHFQDRGLSRFSAAGRRPPSSRRVVMRMIFFGCIVFSIEFLICHFI